MPAVRHSLPWRFATFGFDVAMLPALLFITEPMPRGAWLIVTVGLAGAEGGLLVWWAVVLPPERREERRRATTCGRAQNTVRSA